MLYESSWVDDQHTAVYLSFDGAWQTDEFAEAERELHEMLSEVGHGVSVVVHLVHPQPIAMEMIPQIRSFLALDHPNRAEVVIVAPPSMLNGLHEVIRRSFGGSYPPHLHFAGSLEAAEAVLG